MAASGAQRQAAWRARHAERLAEALAENRRLLAENSALELALADAQAELSRLSGPECAHPPGLNQDGRCGGCGEWL